MTQSVDLYMGPVKIGSATATAGSKTLASFSHASGLADGRFNPGTKAANIKGLDNEPVVVQSTSGANAAGKSYATRIVADGGASLTMQDAHPFAD